MDHITTYVYLGIVALCALGTAIFACIHFSRLPKSEQVNQIKAWLLQAVFWAEGKYGSKTGRLKLSAVYDKFCTVFPWLAQAITFNMFSKYVDDALKEMKNLIENNPAVASIIKKEASKIGEA